MVFEKILEESPITLSDVKEEIKKIEKRDKELTFRANKLKEYIDSITILNKKKADELFTKLQKLNIPRVKDFHLMKLIDILPTKYEEVKVVLSGYAVTISNDNCKKIAEIIKKYV